MRRVSREGLGLGLMGLMGLLAGAAVSADPAGGLREALEQQGWQVQRLADGNELYRPPTGGQAVAPPGGEAVLDDLERALRTGGWRTELGDDGSLILRPPGGEGGVAREAPGERPLRGAPPPSEGTAVAGGVSLPEARHLEGFRHWLLETAADGSLVLRPRPPRRVAAVTSCEGTAVPLSGVELPVDTEAEARALALLWLERAGLSSAAVGRIRRPVKIYLVSIVTAEPPYRLLHQIAIRPSDGRVLLLD